MEIYQNWSIRSPMIECCFVIEVVYPCHIIILPNLQTLPLCRDLDNVFLGRKSIALLLFSPGNETKVLTVWQLGFDPQSITPPATTCLALKISICPQRLSENYFYFITAYRRWSFWWCSVANLYCFSNTIPALIFYIGDNVSTIMYVFDLCNNFMRITSFEIPWRCFCVATDGRPNVSGLRSLPHINLQWIVQRKQTR